MTTAENPHDAAFRNRAQSLGWLVSSASPSAVMEAMSIGRYAGRRLMPTFLPDNSRKGILTSGGRKYVNLFELDASST